MFALGMVELLKSKEYKALARCAAKECPQFKKVTAAQTALAKEIEELGKQPTPDRINRIITSMKAIHRMEDRHSALLCKITRCSDAYAALETKRVDVAMKKLTALEPLFNDVKPGRVRATTTSPKWRTKTGKRSS